MKTKKTFDCIAMKRMAQRRIRSRVQDMTSEQEIDFFRQGSAAFEKAIRHAQKTRDKRKAPTRARQ